MSKEVPLSNKIQPACLPRPNRLNYPANSDVYVIGWGLLSQWDFEVPDILYNVKMKMFDKSACKLVAQEIPKNWTNQICAGKKKQKILLLPLNSITFYFYYLGDLQGKKDTCVGLLILILFNDILFQ